MKLETINKTLRNGTPEEVILWALTHALHPVITTNFRPYEAAILHAVIQVIPDIKVIWCDTGYNTPNTYRHAQELTRLLGLDIDLYTPKQTAAYRDVVMGIPDINHKDHKLFSTQVKLEPFQRAMAEHTPDVWFTNIRKGQTAFRDTVDIVSIGQGGVIKVSPFFYWTDSELDGYLKEHNLPNEFKYFDPTKALDNRECGIHQ